MAAIVAGTPNPIPTPSAILSEVEYPEPPATPGFAPAVPVGEVVVHKVENLFTMTVYGGPVVVVGGDDDPPSSTQHLHNKMRDRTQHCGENSCVC